MTHVIHGAQVQWCEEAEGRRTMKQQQRALRACTEEPSLQSIATADRAALTGKRKVERMVDAEPVLVRIGTHGAVQCTDVARRVCCACPERETQDDDAIRQSANETRRQAPDVARTGTHNRRQATVSEPTGYSAGSGSRPAASGRARASTSRQTPSPARGPACIQWPGSTACNTHDNTAHGRRGRRAQTEAKRCGKAVAGFCFRPPSGWLRLNLANFARIARIGLAVREPHCLR